MIQLHWARNFCLLVFATALVACSNGRGSVEEGEPQTQGPPAPGATFTVGGAVSGLAGSGLVLQLNGGGDLQIANDGAFAFSPQLASGAAYNVTVRAQPTNPAQTCEVANGNGSVANGNVTNVAVVCTTGATAFPISGEVSGLVGSGLVLRNNGRDDLTIAEDGPFTFATSVSRGATYDVTVATQPTNPAQLCSVQNRSGVMQDAEVTNILVVCSTSSFTVGGTVSGLANGRVTLQSNGETVETGNGQFTFPTPLASGAAYSVTVATQPVGQNCTIENGNGAVSDANVTNVTVTCAANVYTIGGAVSGLATNARLVLTMEANGRSVEHTIRTNGPYAFPQSVPNGGGYAVSIRNENQPNNPSQRCDVVNPTGIVAAANVTNVNVTCVTNQFRVGGQVSGLAGSGLVLRLNGGNDLAIASNGAFTFSTPIPSGSRYEVSVAVQPTGPSQTCTVARASGTLGNRDVDDVRVTCATNTYAIRGVVNGLAGERVVLQLSSNTAVEVARPGGAFEFRNVASGSTYNVTVRTQPANPTQACVVENGSGTVAAQDVTNVVVTCTTSSFTVGGEVFGLQSGATITLRNNGADAIVAQGNGAFTFATPVLSGSAYNVEVDLSQTTPEHRCTVENGAGTVGGALVTNVRVNCELVAFTVGGSVTGLAGAGLTLRLNGGAPQPIAAAGPFQLPEPLLNGQAYEVTVADQPLNPSQTCTASDNVGTINGADVTNVNITCTTNAFTIGGVISGIPFGIPIGVQLTAGGATQTIVTSNGPFTFPTPVLSGAPYQVTTVASACSVENGSGTVGAQNVTNVAVTCQ